MPRLGFLKYICFYLLVPVFHILLSDLWNRRVKNSSGSKVSTCNMWYTRNQGSKNSIVLCSKNSISFIIVMLLCKHAFCWCNTSYTFPKSYFSCPVSSQPEWLEHWFSILFEIMRKERKKRCVRWSDVYFYLKQHIFIISVKMRYFH